MAHHYLEAQFFETLYDLGLMLLYQDGMLVHSRF